jgi:RNA polymerase sigma-70 factor, ECF subfamily
MESAIAAATHRFSTDHDHDRAAPARLRPIDLERHRRALMSYARRALRNTADAEDAVQSTLAAALEAPENFAGLSSPQTWLTGILKHKIIDVFRHRARESVGETPIEDELPDQSETLFTTDGHWKVTPTSWGNPEAALASREFFETLQACIACLPKHSARVFTMREMMGLEVNEICDVLGISANSCYVTLHRARMKLRSLLEQRWFALQPSSPD